MPRALQIEMPEVLVSPEESAEATAVYADWSDLMLRMHSGQTDGMEELYQLFSAAMRFYLARHVAADDIEARIYTTLAAVSEAVLSGELREPERLMGFVRSTVQKQIAGHPAPQVSPVEIWRHNPEEITVFHQKTNLINQVLSELGEMDREILTRFYVLEQSQEEICEAMELSATQFRLLKTRAKARFGELGKKKLSLRGLSSAEGGPSVALKGEREVERLLPVVAHAVGVFGDEGKASNWLKTPLPILDDKSPSQILEEPDGVQRIEEILTRIEHNIHS